MTLQQAEKLIGQNCRMINESGEEMTSRIENAELINGKVFFTAWFWGLVRFDANIVVDDGFQLIATAPKAKPEPQQLKLF